jgi:DNA-binding NarL/FixJ family response regulator
VFSALVVDPAPLFCASLASALVAQGHTVVGWTADENEALSMVEASAPSVVLAETYLADGSGYSLARRLRDRAPTVIVTRQHEGDVILDAAAAGAIGCLGHGYTVAELATLVAEGLETGFAVDARRLGTALARAAAASHGDDASGRIARLTPRERDVLRLLAVGLDNGAIGARLYVSPDTVRTHVGRILRKLDVHSRAEAVRVALRSGETRSGDVTHIIGPDLTS